MTVQLPDEQGNSYAYSVTASTHYTDANYNLLSSRCLVQDQDRLLPLLKGQRLYMCTLCGSLWLRLPFDLPDQPLHLCPAWCLKSKCVEQA